MADSTITDLTNLTSAAADDRLPIVDRSDTTMSANGTTKDIAVSDLATAIISAGSIATDTEVATAVSDHNSDTTSVHGIADTTALETTTGAASKVSTHAALTSSVHGISAFGATLVDDADASAARTTLGLGSLATASTITSSEITDGTIVNADINASAAIALSKLATDPLARANHTGTQTASTISDFAEAVDDEVATLLVAGSGVTLTYSDVGNSLTIAASGGGSALSLAGQTAAYDATSAFYAVPGFAPSSNSVAFTLTADALYYCLFFVDTAITINTAVVNVTTGAGTTLRHGIVRLDSADRQPNSTGLIWQTTVSSASTGAKVSTGLSVSLAAGVYASLVVCDAGAAISRAQGPLVPSSLFRFVANTSILHTLRASVGTGAFSDPVPDWTSVQAGAGADQMVGYRWS